MSCITAIFISWPFVFPLPLLLGVTSTSGMLYAFYPLFIMNHLSDGFQCLLLSSLDILFLNQLSVKLLSVCILKSLESRTTVFINLKVRKKYFGTQKSSHWTSCKWRKFHVLSRIIYPLPNLWSLHIYYFTQQKWLCRCN